MSEFLWHALPGELPPMPGTYMVTRRNRQTGKVSVFFDVYAVFSSSPVSSEKAAFLSTEDWEVLAWANFPEPYRPPEPEDNHPDAITAREYMAGDPETIRRLSIFDEDEKW